MTQQAVYHGDILTPYRVVIRAELVYLALVFILHPYQDHF